MQEEWKPIIGYEGIYEVSNRGRVRSVDRVDSNSHFRPGIIRKTRVDANTGYEYVFLRKDGAAKNCTVHRLVAQAFIQKPNEQDEVNHINEDRTDNRVENLEWVTKKQNCNHGNHNRKIKAATLNSHGKAVLMIDCKTGAIKEFVTCSEAARRCGISKSSISKCCIGQQKKAGGYFWKYKE